MWRGKLFHEWGAAIANALTRQKSCFRILKFFQENVAAAAQIHFWEIKSYIFFNFLDKTLENKHFVLRSYPSHKLIWKYMIKVYFQSLLPVIIASLVLLWGQSLKMYDDLFLQPRFEMICLLFFFNLLFSHMLTALLSAGGVS